MSAILVGWNSMCTLLGAETNAESLSRTAFEVEACPVLSTPADGVLHFRQRYSLVDPLEAPEVTRVHPFETAHMPQAHFLSM